MFKSRNFLVKAVGYFLVGFFLFIIVLSFGMPDLGLNCGTSTGTVAVVNGEKVHAMDFYRYRDLKFSKLKDEKMLPYILDNYVMEILVRQKAAEMGLETTDQKLKRYIKETPYFKNPKTKEYDPEILKLILRNYRMSFAEFEKIARKDLLINEFRYTVTKGAAVSTEDAIEKYRAENSKIKIKYAFLSNADIEKAHRKDLKISAKEIDAEMAKNKTAAKDPKKDRNRIEAKLKQQKIAEIRKTIKAEIDAMASKKASFASVSRKLGGKTGQSEIFKIGGNLKNSVKKGVSLYSLAGSDVFRKNLMKLPLNISSPVYENGRGIYIFTPVMRQISSKKPAEKEIEKIKNSLLYTAMNSLQRNLYRQLNEESKILKNLKTN